MQDAILRSAGKSIGIGVIGTFAKRNGTDIVNIFHQHRSQRRCKRAAVSARIPTVASCSPPHRQKSSVDLLGRKSTSSSVAAEHRRDVSWWWLKMQLTHLSHEIVRVDNWTNVVRHQLHSSNDNKPSARLLLLIIFSAAQHQRPLVPNYTAQRQRYKCASELPTVVNGNKMTSCSRSWCPS